MQIVLTGATSFTGFWFASALCERKHQLTLLLRRPLEEYQGIRKTRLNELKAWGPEIIDDCSFGSESFLEYLKNRKPFDLFCHHAAEVKDYKSPDFDFAAALTSNTRNIKSLFEILKKQECRKLLLTGSVFEQREGFSSEGENAISPYGLSKGLTSDVYRYFANLYDLKLGKFVIPNPFGPYEDGERFTSYLAKRWLCGEKADVSFPDYVRDNIPVELLAMIYADFAESLSSERGYSRISPSYRPAAQRYFIQEFAHEMRERFELPCEYILHNQINFLEPKVRINCDPVKPDQLQKWDESKFWNSLAEYYMKSLS